MPEPADTWDHVNTVQVARYSVRKLFSSVDASPRAHITFIDPMHRETAWSSKMSYIFSAKEFVAIDLSDRLERLEVTEEKSGLELSGLSAFLNDEELKVCGEAIFEKPPKNDYDIQVHIVVYDAKSRVIEKASSNIGNKNTPFDAFSLTCWGMNSEISKIRIYVTRD